MGVPCGGMLIRKLWVLVFSTNHRNGAAGSLCCAVGAAQWFLIKAYVFNCDSNVPMCLSLYVLESRNCIPFLLSSFSLFRIRCVIRNLRKFVGNRSSIAQELHICLLWNHIISGSAIKRKVGFPEIQYRACYVKEICIWEIPAPDYQIASLCLWSHSIINLLFVPISIDYDVLFYSLICIAQDFLFYFQRLIIYSWERKRERERESEHTCSEVLVLSPNASCVWAWTETKAQGQEQNPGLLWECQGPNFLNHSLVSPRICISKNRGAIIGHETQALWYGSWVS